LLAKAYGGAFAAAIRLVYIHLMQRRGLIWPVLLGLLAGVGLGLLLGYVVWPAQYDSVTPDLLSAANQDDYAAMIATAYAAPGAAAGGDLDLARTRLERLGPLAEEALRRATTGEGFAGEAAATLLADLQAQQVK